MKSHAIALSTLRWHFHIILRGLMGSYSRLGALLSRIAEYQPTAPADMLNLFYQTIFQAQGAYDASVASVREAKRDFDIL